MIRSNPVYSWIHSPALNRIRAGLKPGKVLKNGSRIAKGRFRWIDGILDPPFGLGPHRISRCLPTTKQVELIDKKEFAKVALNKNSKTFVVHIASLNLVLKIRLDKKAQIASLLTKEVKISEEYSDFTNVFSEEKVLILPERTELNEHVINLENGKQPPYGLIYSLGPIKLETLKTYINTHLKTGFI